MMNFYDTRVRGGKGLYTALRTRNESRDGRRDRPCLDSNPIVKTGQPRQDALEQIVSRAGTLTSHTTNELLQFALSGVTRARGFVAHPVSVEPAAAGSPCTSHAARGHPGSEEGGSKVGER